jgi:hypothetical protein
VLPGGFDHERGDVVDLERFRHDAEGAEIQGAA